MELTDIIIIAVSLSAGVSSIVVLYAIWLRHKIINRNLEKEKRVLLDLKREKFESQLYDIIEAQPMDNLALTGGEELYMNESNCNAKLSTRPINLSFFETMGLDPKDIQVENDMACVVMPFHKNFNSIYSVIKSACSLAGFEPHRSDELFVTGDILRNIVQMILKSQIVIAVLDGNNTNVFYEVGIAHAIGKPVIFIADRNRLNNKNFDVNHNRVLAYDNVNEIRMKLSGFLKQLKEDGRS